MSLLSKFITETEILPENLTEEKLVKIMQNEKFKHFFEKPNLAVELFDELYASNINENFKKEIFTVRNIFNMAENEKLLQKIFNNFDNDDIDKDEFESKIISNFKSEDASYSLSTLLCILISGYPIDLNTEEYFNIFTNNITKIKEILENLGRLENSYFLRVDIIDFLYTLREEYFVAYQKDLFNNDVSWLDAEADLLNEWESQFLKENDNENEVLVNPEDLGLIDITKLKNNKQ